MLINNFKKMISILLAIVLISSTFGFMVFATQKGDVNNDGMVTAVDARLVLQFVAGLVDEKDIENMNCADVNDDSQITAIDARLILQIVAGIVEEPDTNGEKMAIRIQNGMRELLFSKMRSLLHCHVQ